MLGCRLARSIKQQVFALAIQRARQDADRADRTDVVTRLRDAIERSGMTQAQLAAAVGTSASRLSTYLSGKVVPSAAMLVRIERVAAHTLSPQSSLS